MKSRLYRPDPIRKMIDVPKLVRIEVPMTEESPSYKRAEDQRAIYVEKAKKMHEIRLAKYEPEEIKAAKADKLYLIMAKKKMDLK